MLNIDKVEIIKYIPAKLIVEEHVIYSYACKSCEKENGESTIIATEISQTIFYNSMASNELISHTLKYQHAIPLYRQEKYFDMMGLLFQGKHFVTGLCRQRML